MSQIKDQMANDASVQIVYDYETLLRLNSPNLSNLDLTLIGFFNTLQSYQITKEMRFHFPNKHNIHFNRRRVRPKAVISNDPIVLKKLRSCLSKISPQNMDSITGQITEILSAQDYDWKDVSEHFYASAIDNIFLVDVFVQLMIQLNETNHQLIHHLHHLIQNQVYQPRSFTDTLSEEGEHKAKRWQISNGLLITEIYQQNRYSREYLIKILNHWMDSITKDKLIPLEILIKVVPKLSEADLPPEMSGKLKEIGQNKDFPMRLRLLLTLPTSKRK